MPNPNKPDKPDREHKAMAARVIPGQADSRKLEASINQSLDAMAQDKGKFHSMVPVDGGRLVLLYSIERPKEPTEPDPSPA
ncbi:MAG TPA: hypothetical protein VE954_43255 [Oligoflexus sp.]|uniref:hypothetical protein n=1 Tax=Oligoflexus sp. TaxID=1971216 RepID=UPI002D70A30C|nr:hypothetical protein [Oligoflexus sp.]HYX39963.1 hypothetical protein [Oligoflexus sp.]